MKREVRKTGKGIRKGAGMGLLSNKWYRDATECLYGAAEL